MRYTLTTTVQDVSPKIKAVTMPKPIKIEDIPTGSFKTAYIRTNYTGEEDSASYTSRLKCWWYI